MHVGLAHLDIVEPHHRIDFNRMRLGALAHDLAVHLRFGGHVDDEIAEDLRLAAEPPSRAQGAALVDIALLDIAPWRDMIERRNDVVLGELSNRHLDLAARANAATAADRVKIDTEFSRGGQNAGARWHIPALAGWRENDEWIAQGITRGPGARCARVDPAPRRPPGLAPGTF